MAGQRWRANSVAAVPGKHHDKDTETGRRNVLFLLANACWAIPRSVSAALPPMALTPAQMREDLKFLREEWAPHDRSFTAETRKEFERIVTTAMAEADLLSPAEFELEVMLAVAAAGNGHTSDRSLRFLRPLPLRAWWFVDGLYVVSAHPDFAHLLGARIDKFGDLTSKEALAAVAPYIAGTEQRIRYLSAFVLMSSDVLHRIGAGNDADVASATLRLRDGTAEQVRLRPAPSFDPGMKAPDAAYFGFSALIPADPALVGRWPHVLDAVADRPLTYRPAVDVSFAFIGDGGKVLYLRSNQVLSSDQAPLDQKLLFGILQKEVVPRRPNYAVVDLRLNQGGNFFNTLLFTQALPKLLPPGGRIFVLLGRATFSAALVTAAMLKANGGDRTMLIGETMGDADHFWGEGAEKTLPNSKIAVRYADGYHDWANGCADLDHCYWPVVAFGVHGISLEPELHMEPTFADYAAGRDPVLDAALAMAR